MGVSTDAYLFYGYLLPEDYEIDDDLVDQYYLEDEYPVAIGKHCSDECPMYYVYIPGSQTTASRGYPKLITNTVRVPDWDNRLKKFIEEHNLPKPGEKVDEEYGDAASEFGWWLASYWG